jgi:hypothetical protein
MTIDASLQNAVTLKGIKVLRASKASIQIPPPTKPAMIAHIDAAKASTR